LDGLQRHLRPREEPNADHRVSSQDSVDGGGDGGPLALEGLCRRHRETEED
jgi:hypothetical protein